MKTASANISSFSNSKPTKKHSEFCIENCGFIIGKTIKTLGFYNNTHLFDQSSLNVSSRGVFRTLSNIELGAFFGSI